MRNRDLCVSCGREIEEGYGYACRDCSLKGKREVMEIVLPVRTVVEKQMSTNRYTAKLISANGIQVVSREGIADQRLALSIAEAMYAGFTEGISLIESRN